MEIQYLMHVVVFFLPPWSTSCNCLYEASLIDVVWVYPVEICAVCASWDDCGVLESGPVEAIPSSSFGDGCGATCRKPMASWLRQVPFYESPIIIYKREPNPVAHHYLHSCSRAAVIYPILSRARNAGDAAFGIVQRRVRPRDRCLCGT